MSVARGRAGVSVARGRARVSVAKSQKLGQGVSGQKLGRGVSGQKLGRGVSVQKLGMGAGVSVASGVSVARSRAGVLVTDSFLPLVSLELVCYLLWLLGYHQVSHIKSLASQVKSSTLGIHHRAL